jgi:hypothetical protein
VRWVDALIRERLVRDAHSGQRSSDACWWILNRALNLGSGGTWRVHRYCFVAQPVPVDQLVPASRARSTIVRVVTAEDPLVGCFPRRRDVIARRFATGATCIAAERDGKFVGFIWLTESQYDEDEVRCTYVLEGRAAWDFDVHIEPQFRSGRTFARIWDSANAWLREHGYRWTLSRISAFNPGSLAAHRRLGVQPLGTATFVRLGASQVALFSRIPFVHFGWRSDQIPVLRLRAPQDVDSYNLVPH